MESKPPPQPLRFINHQALFAAVRSGDLQSVKTHLTDPASISALMSLQNEAGETLLYIAAEGNLVEVFGYLLGFCDVEVVKIRSRSDMNAFHVAAKLGHLSIVKQLLDAWPELCMICDLTNTSPLYTAAVKNHLDIVRAILDVDASTIRIVRKNGKTSLHTAARYGYLDMVKLLIDKDPGIICIKDKKGQTALHMAVKGHSAAVVEEMLLVDGTILNERDKKGNTAVHIATRKSRPQGFFSRFSRSTTMGSSKTIVDLPSDLLLPILSRLDRKDLQSLSLVSKPFLELSNRFVRKLTFKTLPDDRSFRQIFTRFASVNQINLRTKGVGVARALTAISKSQLNLEALKIRDWPTYPEQISLSGKLNIKSLALGYFPEVKVDEVVEFIRLFPSLEELYFGGCYVWDDAGVESLAAMLPNLIKIDLSNNYYLTDRALYALSANCANLELICIDGCNKFTPQGICTFLLRCRKLR